MATAEIKTTGQLRQMLAIAAKSVMNGDLDIERATALHKLAKNISESLYSETKIAMFRHEVGDSIEKFGELALGDPTDK
jgi:membrane-associated protease RseP (regulator of RpoE activity)